MKNRVWINVGDIVLISLRDFQDEKADIILKYFDEEAKLLKSYGELPEHTKINENEGEDEDVMFMHGAGDDDEDDEEEEKKEDDVDIEFI